MVDYGQTVRSLIIMNVKFGALDQVLTGNLQSTSLWILRGRSYNESEKNYLGLRL